MSAPNSEGQRSIKFFVPIWADDAEITPTQFRILAHLWRRAGRDGECFPSGKSISRDCHVTRATVWRTLSELEKRRYLLRVHGKGRSNHYRLAEFPGRVGLIDGPTAANDMVQKAALPVVQTAALPVVQTTAHKRDKVSIQEKGGSDTGENAALPIFTPEDFQSIAEGLGLGAEGTKAAIDAFLRYKRVYPKDPRDSYAVVQWVNRSEAGRDWFRLWCKSREELAEPVGWREWARDTATNSDIAARNWSSFDLTSKKHIRVETDKWNAAKGNQTAPAAPKRRG